MREFFYKGDLRSGMVVELRKGVRLLTLRSRKGFKVMEFDQQEVIFVMKEGYLRSSVLSENLKCRSCEALDIVKVFEVTNAEHFLDFENDECLELIWERKEPKEEPKEIKIELPNGTSYEMFKKGFTEGCNAIIEELKSGKTLVEIQEVVSSIVKNIETNLGIAKPAKVSVADKMRITAGWLGVEIGEEFDLLSDNSGSEYNPYSITDVGLVDCDESEVNVYLGDLITGNLKYTTKKKEKEEKWIPKLKETVWRISEYRPCGYYESQFKQSGDEELALERKCIFKTEEEAKAEVKKRGWIIEE